jgi:hypothetical protein
MAEIDVGPGIPVKQRARKRGVGFESCPQLPYQHHNHCKHYQG